MLSYDVLFMSHNNHVNKPLKKNNTAWHNINIYLSNKSLHFLNVLFFIYIVVLVFYERNKTI